MGLLLGLSRIYVPQFIRKRQLTSLFQATADGFQVSFPSGSGLSFDKYLKLYAQFTSARAIYAIQHGNSREVQFRLFQNSRRLGQKFREDFKINSIEEIMQMSEIIYKILKIDFHGNSQGDIVVKRCFFSDYYSSNTCRLISALDEGLLAGLSGGRHLNFSQRITEGNSCCRAYLGSGEKIK